MLCRWLARTTVAFLVAACGGMAAHAYDSIVVFGDSYNDVGNIYTLSSALGDPYPPAPYYKGRFSNGPIWIEHIANDWELPLKPSLAGGTDYAVGGAELLQSVTIDHVTIPSISDQVTYYLVTHGGKADPKALYVIEGGGNDILSATSFSAPKLGGAIATGLFGIERALRVAGAKSFLIPDLLDVGLLPEAAAGGEPFTKFASDATVAANEQLDHSLAVEAVKYPQVEIYRIAVFRTFLALANSPTHFGFKNVTTPCLTAAGECADPDHTLWWDGEHPTEFGHAFFAVLVEGVMGNH